MRELTNIADRSLSANSAAKNIQQVLTYKRFTHPSSLL